MATLALAIPALACVGSIGGGETATAGSPGTGGPGGYGGGDLGGIGGHGGGGGMASAAGPLPLRRLNRREYNNTVRDLLGDTSAPADAFPRDKDDDFAYRRAGLVSTQDYSTLRDAAEALAATAEKNVATLAPCTGDETACATKFATGFGLRAYRRPLTAAEVDSLVTLYKAGRAAMSLDHAGGIRLMIEGILQSPSFLYHWESGPAAPTVEGGLVRFGDYETASHLSYFLWGSMPDQALFDAAAARKLETPADIDTQARRMLADPKARETVSQFLEEWMGLDRIADRQKDLTVYPEFKNDDLKAAMLAEARAFIASVVFDGDGKLTTLLTADYSFVNQVLAPVYGMTAQGTTLEQTQLDPNQRAGLLTQPGFLTVTGATDGSNPVKRGRKVYEGLLCGQLPPPPANVPLPKPASAGGTTRQRFIEHSSQECARACHSLMDPIGFAFENFDGIGKYRTTDNGLPVDATGSIELDGQTRAFKDARELSRLLAESAMVQRCFATQWLRYAFKRKETDGDGASIEAVAAALAKGGSVRDLLAAMVGAKSFRYRAPAAGEILQ